MNENTTYVKAITLLDMARARKLRLATAESCTGGLVAAASTDIAGSSDVFDRGFVTDSNAAKHDMLGVPQRLIEAHGAVSAEVARAMALGALEIPRRHRRGGDGRCGTGRRHDRKAGWPRSLRLRAARGGVDHVERRFGSLTRGEIRAASVAQALDMAIAAVEARERPP